MFGMLGKKTHIARTVESKGLNAQGSILIITE